MYVRAGIDLGTSKVCASVDIGGEWFNVVIPAYVGDMGGWQDWHKGDIAVRVGNDYKYVGDVVLRMSEVKGNYLKDDKMKRPTLKPLLHALLGAVAHKMDTKSLEMDIVATLPFDASEKQKVEMTQMLKNVRNTDCIIEGVPHTANVKINRVEIKPEGLCSWFNYVLDDYGKVKKENLASKMALVVCLGLYHLNLVMVDAGRLIGPPVSRSLPYGLSLAHEAICRKEDGAEMWEVDKLLREGRLDGSEAFAKLADQVNTAIDNLLSRQTRKPDLYYATGGGGIAVYKWLKQNDKIASPSPVTDDAEGARKIAVALWPQA